MPVQIQTRPRASSERGESVEQQARLVISELVREASTPEPDETPRPEPLIRQYPGSLLNR